MIYSNFDSALRVAKRLCKMGYACVIWPIAKGGFTIEFRPFY